MSPDVYQSLGSYLSWLFHNLFGSAQPHMHFWILSAIVLASGIGVVTSKNLIHAALLLALSFIAVAGIFILLNAEFLAVVQVLVYAGGVVTLIIFAIMLSEGITGKNIVTHNRQSVTALGVSVLMALIMFATLFYDENGYYIGAIRWWLPPERREFPPIENSVLIGKSMMTTYTLAFWIASIILVISMIGSLIIARTEKDMPGEGKLEPGSESANESGSTEVQQ